jgi:hypothetical protein
MGTTIGILIGLAGVFVGVITYLQTRDDRHLDYEVKIYTRLLHADAAALGVGLRLFYGVEEIEDPHLTVIQLMNTGNRPIRPEDQLEPIHIDFGDTVRLLYAETVEGSGVGTDIYLEEHYVKVPPVLFNQGDWIAIKILTDGPGQPSIRGRIVGVRDFRHYYAAAPTRLERHLGIVAALVVGALYITVLAVTDISHWPTWLQITITLAVIPVSIGTGIALERLADRRVEKRRRAFRVTI